jgi:hypothetical protein
MVNFFMSSGLLTESRSGFEAGPKYLFIFGSTISRGKFILIPPVEEEALRPAARPEPLPAKGEGEGEREEDHT